MRKNWLFPGDNDEPYVSQRAGAYQPQGRFSKNAAADHLSRA